MRKRIKYENEPLGKLRVVRDFLPPPEELVFREDAIKVTLALSRRSVDFFKAQAARHGTQYQKMIRRLLDRYAEHYADSQASEGATERRRPAAGRPDQN
jgi:hypothetical protein